MAAVWVLPRSEIGREMSSPSHSDRLPAWAWRTRNMVTEGRYSTSPAPGFTPIGWSSVVGHPPAQPASARVGPRCRERHRWLPRRRRRWCSNPPTAGAIAGRRRPWPRARVTAPGPRTRRRCRSGRPRRAGRGRAARAWGSTPSTATQTRWGSRPAGSGSPSRWTPSTAVSASARRSVSARLRRGLVGQRAARRAASAAAPRPDEGGHVLQPGAPGPFLVAAEQQRARARRPRRTSSAPVPAGPPSLWPLTDRGRRPARRGRGAPGRRPGRRRRARARPARGTRPRPRPPAGRCRPRGCPTGRAPARCPGVTAASTSSGSIRPSRSTPTVVTDPPKASANVVDAWRTAECSTAASTTWGAPGVDGSAHRAPGGRGDGLGGAAGEHDLTGPGAQERGHLLAGLLERDTGGHALGVDATGVADLAVAADGEPRRHRGHDLRSGRRGGRVVEVVAGHARAADRPGLRPRGR